MPASAFDPKDSVRFDLRSGAASDAGGARLVLVPADALAALSASAPAALSALGAAIGTACGARVAARLGGEGGVRSATIEVALSHLAGELAIAGIGAITIERWGRAMVCVIANASIADDDFLGSVLSAALRLATGHDLAAGALGGAATERRFFVGSASTAARAASLALEAEGRSVGEVIGILHGGAR